MLPEVSAMHTTRLLCITALMLAPGCWVTAASAQSVPDRILVGYWHNWGYSPNNLTLSAIPSEYDIVNVAFAVPTTAFGSTMTFSPSPTLYPNPAAFQTDMQTLQAQGRKVLISVGGGNSPIHLNTALDVSNFVTSMLGIITTWGFDGMDLDLESGSLSLDPGDTDFTSPTTPGIVNLIAAVQQLLVLLPPDFMLTAAPETATVQGATSAYGGVWGSYLPVIHALRQDLDWVQVQHYNTGPMLGRNGVVHTSGTADFHTAMADMLLSGFTVPASGMTFPPLAPEQVVIGLPASTLAAGSGYTAPSLVHQALDHLYLGLAGTSTYPLGNPGGFAGMRGLMTWSINWDVHGGALFSQSHRAYLDGVNLKSDVAMVSYGAGATVNFTLRAGLAHAGRAYYLVPSLSGTSPGTAIMGGGFFPINLDTVSYWPFQPATAPFFPGFFGVFDATGQAQASMIVPPTSNQAPFASHYAFILTYPWDFYSPAIRIDFVP